MALTSHNSSFCRARLVASYFLECFRNTGCSFELRTIILSRHSRNQTGHGLLCLDGIDAADRTTCGSDRWCAFLLRPQPDIWNLAQYLFRRGDDLVSIRTQGADL